MATMNEPILIRNLRPRERPLPEVLVEPRPATPPEEPGVRAPQSKHWPIAVLFAACWSLLLLVDSNWSDLIPRLNLARILVPLCLGTLLILERTVRASRFRAGFVWWLVALTLCGSLSSVLGLSPILGMLKLAMYLSILVPLCLSSSIQSAFAPRGAGFVCLATLALGVLIVSLILIPFTGTGVFDNPNKLAAFAVTSWPLLAILRQRASGAARLSGTIGLVICALACVLMFSRGSIVALGCGLITCYVVQQRPTVGSVVFGLLSLIVFGAMMFILNEPLKSLAYKGREQFLDNTRQAMFMETINVWKYRPLLGYGFGLSWTLSPDDEQQVLTTGRMSWFTVEFGNSTLAMLSGGGLVIALLFYGVIGVVLLRGLRTLQAPLLASDERGVLGALIAGIVGMLAHAQAEAWLMAPLTSMTVMFWLYVSIVQGLSRDSRR